MECGCFHYRPHTGECDNAAIMSTMPTSYTRDGDNGYTGLLGEGRVPKYHPRPEAYGAVDEASAAIGLARALATSSETAETLKSVQRDLYTLMAELAASTEQAHKFRGLDQTRVRWLEGEFEKFSGRVDSPQGFVLGGDSPAGGALDVARTIVRRAERHVARLVHEAQVSNPDLLRYLNRLSSLCFVLALWENLQAGVDRPSLAHPTEP